MYTYWFLSTDETMCLYSIKTDICASFEFFTVCNVVEDNVLGYDSASLGKFQRNIVPSKY
jgi:hypothetical protein